MARADNASSSDGSYSSEHSVYTPGGHFDGHASAHQSRARAAAVAAEAGRRDAVLRLWASGFRFGSLTLRFDSLPRKQQNVWMRWVTPTPLDRSYHELREDALHHIGGSRWKWKESIPLEFVTISLMEAETRCWQRALAHMGRTASTGRSLRR